MYSEHVEVGHLDVNKIQLEVEKYGSCRSDLELTDSVCKQELLNELTRTFYRSLEGNLLS